MTNVKITDRIGYPYHQMNHVISVVSDLTETDLVHSTLASFFFRNICFNATKYQIKHITQGNKTWHYRMKDLRKNVFGFDIS